MSDDLDHHTPRERKDQWSASELTVAVFGMVGSFVLLLLVVTGVIHQ